MLLFLSRMAEQVIYFFPPICYPKGVVIHFFAHTSGPDYTFLSIFLKKDIVEICANTDFMPLVVLENGLLNESPLTARERDVLHLWAKGYQKKKIAELLQLSPETIKKHLRNVYLKLNAHNKVQALTKAGYL